jgi:gliding motility-associated protein GldL
MGLSELVQSHGWKNFMSKVYGIGASVVLVGAMFKIMHWPGAGVMLVVGLSTEAFIFFTSAFEPLHKEWDWSLVYPELAGMHEDIEDEEVKKAKSSKKSALEKFDELLNNAEITPDLFEKLGNGLRSLNQTTEKLADISQVSLATNNYISSFEKASEKVTEFSNLFGKSAEIVNSAAIQNAEKLNNSINILASTYENVAQTLENTSNKFASDINNSGSNLINKFSAVYENGSKLIENSIENFVKQISQSSLSLSEAYLKLAEVVNSEAEQNKNNVKSYSEQLQIMTKNLTALNAIYELQLQGSNEYLENSKKIFAGIDTIMQTMTESANDVKKYREEIAKLGQNLAAMNTIYGNMLAAMNFNRVSN